MSEWKEPTNAAEELLCSVPSLLTDHPWVREAIVQLRAHAAALERIAALEAENAMIKAALQTSQNKLKASGRYKLREENARLRHHAEAMASARESKEAYCPETFTDLFDIAYDAYRADFPKEEA